MIMELGQSTSIEHRVAGLFATEPPGVTSLLKGGVVEAAGFGQLAIEREATFIHHFFEIAIAEGIAQIPTYTEKDDVGLIMTPLEEIGLGHEQTSE